MNLFSPEQKDFHDFDSEYLWTIWIDNSFVLNIFKKRELLFKFNNESDIFFIEILIIWEKT